MIDVNKRNHVVTPAENPAKSLPSGNILGRARARFPALGGRLLGFVLFLMAGIVSAAEPARPPFRFAMTAAIVHDQQALLADWRDYLASRIGRPVEIISRDRYTDTLEMLEHDRLDAAWLSTYPYILVRPKVRLVATASYQGRPAYRAYLIVSARDHSTTSLLQLRGTIFAYADTISHTGYLIPRYELARAGIKPASFFRKTFFTWGHRNSIEAVAAGLADGAYVDSYVWDSLQKIAPGVTSQTRIVSRSDEFAFPPIVANRSLSAKDFRLLQKALFHMHEDPAGKKLLEKLNLDRFAQGEARQYDSVAKMMHAVGDQ